MVFTAAPAWYILLCLLLAAGYALALYFRERRSEIPGLLRLGLGIIRFAATFIIAFLLLTPFIRTISRSQEKPLVVIAQDNSGSVAMNADSSFYSSAFPSMLDGLAGSLQEDYDVRSYLFGETTRAIPAGHGFGTTLTFEDKLTDISDLFSIMSSLYANRNVGAVVLATDGIYNSGLNPLYEAGRSGFPVYAIALGDTTRQKDIIISHVSYNRLVYLGNSFPVQVTVQAHECAGLSTTLGVSENGQSLHAEKIQIARDDYTQTFNLLLEASETGLRKYRISLSAVDSEQSTGNNFSDIFIEVLDARNKILILYHSPHPDVAAIRYSLEASGNYEVEDFPVRGFTGPLEAYNMVVLHQVPSVTDPATRIISGIREQEIPVLYILGTQSDMARINQLETGLNIISERNLFEEALPSFNPAFGLFTVSEDTRSLLNSFPPLYAPSGNYQAGTMVHSMAFQRIGSVQTSRPMIVLSQNLQYRSGLIAGEGIWRWRMMNYALAGNQDAFNELLNKIFQFISLREQKQNLRIYHQGNFAEYERVVFDADLYNRNYELVNEPDLEMTITDDEGKQYPFAFSRTRNAYRLDAGRLQPANYTFRARATLGEETFTASGQFSVSRVDLESVELMADHDLLRSMADQTSGKVYTPSQLDQLERDILGNADIKPVIYTRKTITELINFPWLLAAAIFLLSMEWFVRKRSGAF